MTSLAGGLGVLAACLCEESGIAANSNQVDDKQPATASGQRGRTLQPLRVKDDPRTVEHLEDPAPLDPRRDAQAMAELLFPELLPLPE